MVDTVIRYETAVTNARHYYRYWTAVTNVVNRYWTAVTNAVNRYWTAVTNAVNRYWTAVTNAVNRYWTAVNNAVNRYWTAVASSANRYWTAVTTAVNRYGTAVTNAVNRYGTAVTNAVNRYWTAVTNTTRTLKWHGRNRMQIIERLSRATCRVTYHVVRRDSSAIKFDRVEIAFILALCYWLIHLPMKEGRKPEYPEKTPGEELQKFATHVAALPGA